MSSNLRRTETLQRLKTRELWLQSANGSLPSTDNTIPVVASDGLVGIDTGVSIPSYGVLNVPGTANISTLDVAGETTTNVLTVTGQANVEDLNVTGDTVLDNLTVTGPTDLSGDVTVSALTTRTLTVQELATINTLLAGLANITNLTIGGIPIYPATTYDTRYFTTSTFTIESLTNVFDISWPPGAGYWTDVSGFVNGQWTCSIVGQKFDAVNTVGALQNLNAYCRFDTGTNRWKLYAKFYDSAPATDQTHASFDIMAMPLAITDDRRSVAAATFDIFARATLNGGVTPYTGTPVRDTYLKVLDLPASEWPTNLTNVSQIVSLQFEVYAETNTGSGTIIDAKVRLVNTGIEETNIFYAFGNRITVKSGPIPNGGGANYGFYSNAIGTPGTGANAPSTITDQGKLREVFGVGYTSDIIDKTRPIQLYWFVGYFSRFITNCVCTQFKIVYNP